MLYNDAYDQAAVGTWLSCLPPSGEKEKTSDKNWKMDVSGLEENPEATGEQVPAKKHNFPCAVRDVVDEIPWQTMHMVDVEFKRDSEEFNTRL